MNSLVFPLILCCLLSTLVTGYAKSEDELIQEYLKELDESNYERRIAPTEMDGKGKPVKVSISMFIMDLNHVADSMDFKARFYLRQRWVDSRLRYSDKNISHIVLRSPEKLWTPDLFFMDEREGSLHNVIQPNIFVKIKPDGEVLFSVRISGTFMCTMDFRNYPHDTHKCEINIESYGFETKDIELNWITETNYSALGVSSNLALVDFELVEVSTSKREVKLSSGEYSSLQAHLTFKRRIGFFVTRLYLPSVILVVLSWLSLWIKAGERSLRLALLLVVMYLIVTMSSEVNVSTPTASYIKAIDVWIGFSILFVFAAFLEFIAVTIIFHREDKKESCRGKAEILPNFDSEAKEENLSTNSLKSPLSKLINMIDARNGGKARAHLFSNRVDRICRILFPIIFVLFNIVYWSVYCSV